MKKNILLVFSIFAFALVNAQTFTANFGGAAGTIPATSPTQTCFPITVSGVGNINDVSLGLAQVCLDIIHPNVSELEIVLTAPDGTVVPLSMQNGGTGDNYGGTCFTATAATSIKFGTAPFSGSYTPEGHLGAVNNGQNANGVWNLCIQDRRTAANAGSLTSYSLTFSSSPAPLPPILPACTTTLPGTSSCANATVICDFNGLCGTTSGTSVQDWGGSGLNGCFGLENNSFVRFIASATTASFSVWVPTHSIPGNYNLGGIQMLFFSGTCDAGAVTTYGCYPHILPYNAAGQPIISVVSASGLTPGNTYYLMIDGFNSDHCSFTIEAISGVSILKVTPAAATICAGGNVSLTASGANGIYSWSPAATLSASTGATVTATPASTTTYTVASTGIGSCAITKLVTVTVNQLPVISSQPGAATQNICLNGPTTSLNVMATAGSGTISSYQWYSNSTASNSGGTLIPGATSATYTPPSSSIGTTYYYCIINNSNNCPITSNVSGPVIVSAGITTPTATVTVQPTCADPTGTIVITAPTGANIQYSVGGVYQTSGTFTGLPANTYNVTAKDNVTGCVSVVLPLTVNAATGGPATPTGSVTVQPTCAAPNGTIVITAPTGANLQYSTGGAYQTSGTFTGLAANTYNVTVKDNTSGCISPVLQLTVNPPSGAPATPTATVTVQPTCTVTTGTIVVTAPVGANIQYSIGGSYQAGGTFIGLAPNVYNVTAKDISTGCISSVLQLTVNVIPPAPAVPTASVTVQPGCIISTGTIVVSNPAGANIEYSIGGAYQSSGTFTGLTPNNYNITAKDVSTGCISSILPLTVNVVPPPPAAPTASVTVQPTCASQTGTIVVTAPVGTNIQYSSGAAYQTATTFTGLVPNTYAITAKDISTGCVSAVSTVIVNAVPGLPASPVVSGDSRCGSGIVNLAASGTGTLTWYSDAALTNAVASGVNFSPVVNTTSTYYVTATNNNCESSPTIVTATINALPAPDLGGSKSVCAGDKLVLNPGSFSSYLWQDNSTQPTFSVSESGTYSVIVKNLAGCQNQASVSVIVIPVCDDIYFPSAFTPNGDSRNDEFGPLPVSALSLVNNYNLVIYNRYGQKVFQTYDPAKKWSGKFNDKIIAGNYAWYATYNFRGDSKVSKGNIIIIK